MGCDASKSVRVDDQGKPSVKDTKGTTEVTSHFTDLQVDCLRSTWPLLAKNKVAHGCRVFQEIFTLEPVLGQKFSFYSAHENLQQNVKARNHAKMFMQTIEDVCDHLEDAEDADSDIVRQLLFLGAKHGAMPDLDFNHFSLFNKAAHITWMQVLAEEYTEDVKDAWNTLFEFIEEKLVEGYQFYFEDELKNAQDADSNVTSDDVT